MVYKCCDVFFYLSYFLEVLEKAQSGEPHVPSAVLKGFVFFLHPLGCGGYLKEKHAASGSFYLYAVIADYRLVKLID